MTFAPDGRLFICQQGGALRVAKDGALLPTAVVNVEVDESGERGLLGVAIDPDFGSNGFFYLYYTTATAPARNRVSRFTIDGDVAVAGSETVVLELNQLSGATNHNGGAIHFGPDGKLYIAVGDNANGAHAQSFSNLFGKMLRMNPDGTTPQDNPFLNRTSGRNQLIWALGLRNPYTFSFQRGTGRMFINDVGESRREEVNKGVPKANYGWPIYEGPSGVGGFRNPYYSYGQRGAEPNGCAITGGAFYAVGSAVPYPRPFTKAYFFADFCGGWIYAVRAKHPGAPVLFASGIDRPVDLLEHDGSIHYLSRGSGTVMRIDYQP
jgi:glucose/arabinose dehydrogenase